MSNSSGEEIERGALDLDTIHNFTSTIIPSPSVSSEDNTEEIERKKKETRRKRQVLAFVIICVLVVGGVIIEKIKF
jgi:predicted metal-dependent hydrolase